LSHNTFSNVQNLLLFGQQHHTHGYQAYQTARYTTDHEWVSFDADTNIGTVGVTDYAQQALGDVVFVELPNEGDEVAQTGESLVSICLYSPLANVVPHGSLHRLHCTISNAIPVHLSYTPPYQTEIQIEPH
jgi:hypothetical protein